MTTASLAAKRPAIIVAFHSPEEVEGVFQELAPLGYEHEEIAPHLPGDDRHIGRDVLFRPSPRA